MQVHHLLASCAVVRPNPPKRRAAPKEPKKPARRGRPPRRRVPETEEYGYSASRIIKRYGNRRLYDAKLRRAVTATEIAEMVREGEDLRVIDADTGTDITKRFLVQIILEEHNVQALELLPVALLRLLIGARTAPYGTWLGQYLQSGADWFRRQADGVSQAGAASKSALEELWSTWGQQTGWPTGAAAPSAAAAPPSGKRAASGEGQELRSEMDELQRRLSELAAKMKRR